jgi:hypothetical protein
MRGNFNAMREFLGGSKEMASRRFDEDLIPRRQAR